jgi:hypothetical protein
MKPLTQLTSPIRKPASDRMKAITRNLVLASLFVVAAAAISIPLGIKSEGIALQLGFDRGTPGLFVADRLTGNEPLGEARMRRELFVALSVDGPLWFLAICGTAFAVVLYRRKRRHAP